MRNENNIIKNIKKGTNKMKKNISLREYRVFDCDTDSFLPKVFSDRLSASRYARICRDSTPSGYTPHTYLIADIRLDDNLGL